MYIYIAPSRTTKRHPAPPRSCRTKRKKCRTYIFLNAYLAIDLSIHRSIDLYIYTYLSICIYIYIYIYIYTCMCVYVCIYSAVQMDETSPSSAA